MVEVPVRCPIELPEIPLTPDEYRDALTDFRSNKALPTSTTGELLESFRILLLHTIVTYNRCDAATP